ncbi:6-O-methylguanine DNA methyltransferase [Geopyxis carbonaria]|nr:6-O-methylguanine DNA methyltransferase [Geopyxis carbonaria]
MPRRSDEAEMFITGVYLAVQEIPHGRVTSYGHIAKLIGKPQNPRQVGQALKHLPAPSSTTASTTTFNTSNVPWQRVVSSTGVLPVRDNTGGAERHAQALRAEGVEVTVKRGGELVVDLKGGFGWFPEELEEEGWGGEEEDDEREEGS